MGWLSMPRSSMGGHATPKAYLDDQFTYSREEDGGGRRGARDTGVLAVDHAGHVLLGSVPHGPVAAGGWP